MPNSSGFYLLGDSAETQTCAYAALDQSYILQEVFTELYSQAHKTLQIIDGFLRYLRSQRTKRS